MWVLVVMVFFEVILTGWIRRILHIGKFRLGSHICGSVKASLSSYICLSPAATGDEAATEGEAHVRAFVFAPGAERHNDDSAVVFRSVLKRLRGTKEFDKEKNE